MMMNIVLTFFFLLINLKIAKAQRIIVSPNITTSTVGGTATFCCDISYWIYPSVTWKFNGTSIYSLRENHEEYHMGNEKYSVQHSGRVFTLTVKHLDVNDGGTYSCSSVPDKEAEVRLFVIGTPIMIYNGNNFQEGDEGLFTCQAAIGGPEEDESLKDYFPTLGFSFNDAECKPMLNVDKGQQQSKYNIVSQEYSVTIQPTMHRQKPACHIKTKSVCVNSALSTKLNVVYSVRNVAYIPNKENYMPGSLIRCTAEGNPTPTLIWENTKTKSSVETQWLNITKEMMGDNSWKCTAKNDINSTEFEEHIIANFIVVGKIAPNQFHEVTPGAIDEITTEAEPEFDHDNSRKRSGIVLGVLLPVLALSGVAIYYYSRYHQDDEDTADKKDGNSDRPEDNRNKREDATQQERVPLRNEESAAGDGKDMKPAADKTDNEENKSLSDTNSED